MPPRRAKAAGSKASASKTLTAEELDMNRNLELMLQDFDKGLEVMVGDMEAQAETVCKSIHSMFMISLIKLPPSTKALTLDEYMEKVCPLVDTG